MTASLALRQKIRKSKDERIGKPEHLVEWYKGSLYPLYSTQQCNRYNDCLYLIYGHQNGLYKIGITTNRFPRYKAITKASGNYVSEVIHIILENGYDESSRIAEAAIHCFFGNKKVAGEWFDLSVKDVLAIKNLIWEIEGESIDDRHKEHLVDKDKHIGYRRFLMQN